MATNDELLERIWIDPKRCFGKPCIRGTRIPVSLVLDLLASKMSPEEILEEYPGLTPLDIQACLAYGAEMSQLISLAVTQAVGIWSNESYSSLRAKRGSREDFLKALEQVPDIEPPEHDRLPEGYQPKSI